MINARWLLFVLAALPAAAKTIRVPADQPSIQAAIDAAANGDTVLVAPGTYRESLKIEGKAITLASHFLESRDEKHIAATVIDVITAEQKRGASCLIVAKNAPAGTRVIGFTFKNAAHAVTIHGQAEIQHNRFTANGDALSFENGRGTVRFNVFEENTDDGIDMDGASQAVIEDNVIRNNRDDGIEVRLHKYNGAPLEIVIRRNLIVGNGEDGLQLIDYPGKSDRFFRVEHNVFAKNAMAAIGSMKDGNTRENYEGAELPERVFIVNNTFVGGPYGITGGENMVVVNNVFTGIGKIALKRVAGDSAAGRNLVWKNGTDFEECDLAQELFVSADPMLDAEFRPKAGSPCVGGGVTALEFNGETLKLDANSKNIGAVR